MAEWVATAKLTSTCGAGTVKTGRSRRCEGQW
jgi:hypothetical protein